MAQESVSTWEATRLAANVLSFPAILFTARPQIVAVTNGFSICIDGCASTKLQRHWSLNSFALCLVELVVLCRSPFVRLSLRGWCRRSCFRGRPVWSPLGPWHQKPPQHVIYMLVKGQFTIMGPRGKPALVSSANLRCTSRSAAASWPMVGLAKPSMGSRCNSLNSRLMMRSCTS